LDMVVVLVHPPVDDVVHKHVQAEVLPVPVPLRVSQRVRLIAEREIVIAVPLVLPTTPTQTAPTVVDEIDRGVDPLAVVVIEVVELVEGL